MTFMRNAVCTCLVASGLAVAPPVAAARPAPVSAPVQLTAAAQPLAVDVPELLTHVEEFAALVEPLAADPVIEPDRPVSATSFGATGLTAPSPGATSLGFTYERGSITNAVTNAISWFPARLFRELMDGRFTTLIDDYPVIGPLIYNIVITVAVGGLGVAYAVGAVLLPIESTIYSVIATLGGLVRNVFPMTAAQSLAPAAGVASATAEAGGPEPTPRAAARTEVPTRPTTDEHRAAATDVPVDPPTSPNETSTVGREDGLGREDGRDDHPVPDEDDLLDSDATHAEVAEVDAEELTSGGGDIDVQPDSGPTTPDTDTSHTGPETEPSGAASGTESSETQPATD